MFTKEKTRSVVGLDVDGSSLAATEVRVGRSAEVVRTAVSPLPAGTFRDGEVIDPDGLANALRESFAEHGLSKDVRLGVANQRVVFRTIQLPIIEDPKQMDAAVRFQAAEEMPMPLDSASLEYQVIGGTDTAEGGPKVIVALVAARREMISRLLEPVRSAGLRPQSVDLSAFGMIRALAGSDGAPPATEGGNEEFVPATMFCNLGDVTNLAVARRFACHFARVSQFGMQQIVEQVAENAELTDEHAAMWLQHVGLATPVEALEGDPRTVQAVRSGLEEGAGGLAEELRLSIDYYGAQEDAIPVGPVVLSGAGSAIPGLSERLASDLGREVHVRRPEALAGFADTDAARLTMPYGLALEN
jgi:type IV pilus assembly protein PilM